MNCRERVLRTIRFERPDRIPFTSTISPTALFGHGQRVLDLCRQHPNDFYDPALLALPQRDTAHYRPDGSYYRETADEWGSVWVFLREDYGGEVKFPVMDDWSKLRDLKFPPVPGCAPAERERARADMDRAKERYVGWAGGGSLFERMQYLRGSENLLMDLVLEPDNVVALADRLLEEAILPTIRVGLEAGADVIGFTDDWGSQRQLLINPRTWREIFKPRYQRMFDLVHSGGALAWMHSDGHQLDIIPDWIELGLDVLNPQLSCNDPATLQKLAAGKLCISGDVDRQYILARATPAEIDRYIRGLYEVFGAPEGGFIYNLSIEEVPFENIVAAFEAVCAHRDLG